MSRKLVVVLALVVTLVVASSTAAFAKGVVRIPSLKFKPANISVSKGEKVVWKNTDDVGHNVSSTSSNWSKNTNVASGARTSFTFKKKGTFKYKCAIHPSMTGKVQVG